MLLPTEKKVVPRGLKLYLHANKKGLTSQTLRNARHHLEPFQFDRRLGTSLWQTGSKTITFIL